MFGLPYRLASLLINSIQLIIGNQEKKFAKFHIINLKTTFAEILRKFDIRKICSKLLFQPLPQLLTYTPAAKFT